MANTYSQIHIQVIFAVKYRQAVIGPDWQVALYKYITGIVQHFGHKILAINGMPDHVHLFVGMRPNQSLSDLMQQVKGSSARWVNGNRFGSGRFAWQEGYGAFSYSRSQCEAVIRYVLNQQEHHKRYSFREEYLELLRLFEVDFQEQYIFQELK